MKPILAVNTNIITGFLGVGKTTLIKQLLANKPEDENWAVLVNEFGEVGIDGGLLGQNESDVMIKEVAGGCMCCASGISTQVAVNQILQRVRPDRLLIEPTGLGHPREMLKTLSQDYFKQVINLQSTLCLVDARKLSDNRYIEHDIFKQQIAIADVIIANKAQHYSDEDNLNFNEHIPSLNTEAAIFEVKAQFNEEEIKAIYQKLCEQKDLANVSQFQSPTLSKPSLLAAGSNSFSLFDANASLSASTATIEASNPFDSTNIICKENQGDGCFSIGWMVCPMRTFDFDKLMCWVGKFNQSPLAETVLRLKAVMITYDGILGINMVDGELSLSEHDDALDSRLEVISMAPLEASNLQKSLLACCD